MTQTMSQQGVGPMASPKIMLSSPAGYTFFIFLSRGRGIQGTFGNLSSILLVRNRSLGVLHCSGNHGSGQAVSLDQRTWSRAETSFEGRIVPVCIQPCLFATGWEVCS